MSKPRRQRKLAPYQLAGSLTDDAVRHTLLRMEENLGTLCYDGAQTLCSRDRELSTAIGQWVRRFCNQEYNPRKAKAACWDGVYIAYSAYTLHARETPMDNLGWFLDGPPGSLARERFEALRTVDDDSLLGCVQRVQLEDTARRTLTLGASSRYNGQHRMPEDKWRPEQMETARYYMCIGIGTVAFAAAYGQHMRGVRHSEN